MLQKPKVFADWPEVVADATVYMLGDKIVLGDLQFTHVDPTRQLEYTYVVDQCLG